jgi:hypothetical protein
MLFTTCHIYIIVHSVSQFGSHKLGPDRKSETREVTAYQSFGSLYFENNLLSTKRNKLANSVDNYGLQSIKCDRNFVKMKLLTVIFRCNLNYLPLSEAKTSCFNRVKSNNTVRLMG